MPRALACVIATVALLAGGALASADDDPLPLDEPVVADLDGDGATETVRAREVQCFSEDGPRKPPCEKDSLRSIYAEVVDNCAQGARTVRLKLSREMDFASLADVVDADNDGQARELALELRAGATARGVQAKVVRFRARSNGCIEVQKTLFSYPRPETIGRRPKGTAFRTGFISLGNFDKTRKGLELRTDETYSRPTDAGCCPSFRRVTTWTYVAARSGYRAYRTRLAAIPRPT